METGKNTITDPAMAKSTDHSDETHPILDERYTKQPFWWQKKRVCRKGRSKFKPECKDACWTFNNHQDKEAIFDYIVNGL